MGLMSSHLLHLYLRWLTASVALIPSMVFMAAGVSFHVSLISCPIPQKSSETGLCDPILLYQVITAHQGHQPNPRIPSVQLT